MKIFNIGLVGYGKMGRVFAKEIKINKRFRLKKILRGEQARKNPECIKKFFKLKDIDIYVITSPVSTHFKYLKNAYAANKDIIIEKPLVENQTQLKKLIKLNKNFKRKILIHHNDVLNFEKFKIKKKFGNFSKIKKIEMIFGKKEKKNSYIKPHFDWLPHPLSIIFNIFGKPKKFKILSYSRKRKNTLILENLNLSFNIKNFKIFVMFSNSFTKPHKKVIVYKDSKKQTYNGYSLKNQRTVKILLEKYYYSRYINDVKKNINTYKSLFQIDKKLTL